MEVRAVEYCVLTQTEATLNLELFSPGKTPSDSAFTPPRMLYIMIS